MQAIVAILLTYRLRETAADTLAGKGRVADLAERQGRYYVYRGAEIVPIKTASLGADADSWCQSDLSLRWVLNHVCLWGLGCFLRLLQSWLLGSLGG